MTQRDKFGEETLCQVGVQVLNEELRVMGEEESVGRNEDPDRSRMREPSFREGPRGATALRGVRTMASIGVSGAPGAAHENTEVGSKFDLAPVPNLSPSPLPPSPLNSLATQGETPKSSV